MIALFTLIKKYRSYPAQYRHTFLMKNITPKQLAIIIATILSILSLGAMFTLKSLNYLSIRYITIFLLSIFHGFIGYGLFYIALEQFIYRRIKLIYKRIHRLKEKQDIASASDMVDMGQNIMEEVETEVVNWTEEKKNEINQLKQLETYRREFLGNVSHELKTPIFNIQGYLDTLIDTKLEDDNINMHYLHRAAKNADRLIHIVNELETITRHEAGELQIQWDHFKIFDLTQEVIEGIEMMADAKSITIDIKPGSDLTMLVNADKEKIRQVLSNLISNSIKYGRKNGTTLIGIYDMAEYALIEVSDNGRGIEEKHLPRVFERFYRVDASRSRPEGGSGLGLAIVKHIVEAHKQSINVRSSLDIGSTFGFTLAKAKK